MSTSDNAASAAPIPPPPLPSVYLPTPTVNQKKTPSKSSLTNLTKTKNKVQSTCNTYFKRQPLPSSTLPSCPEPTPTSSSRSDHGNTKKRTATAGTTTDPSPNPAPKRNSAVSTGGTVFTATSPSILPPPSTANSPPEASFLQAWLFFSVPLPQITPLPVNYSSDQIATTVRSLLTAVFFHDRYALLLSVTGKPDKQITRDSPIPTSVASLQSFIRFNNFSSLLRGGRTLPDHVVKGRIHLCTCQPIQSLLTTVTTSHPQWTLRRDQFHGDVPVDCGWLLYSSKKMNCLAIQSQLTTLALAELQIAIPFVCLWRQVDGPGSYPTISTYTIVICTSHRISPMRIVFSKKSCQLINSRSSPPGTHSNAP